MARRGLLASLIHSSQVAARERQRAQQTAARDHAAAMRRAEQAQQAAVRLGMLLARSSSAEKNRLEKEAREAHLAAKASEVERLNLGIQEVNADLDAILASTLAVDDYINLDTFRVRAEHPPFDARGSDVPTVAPLPLPDPPEPVFSAPMAPKGILGSLFGKTKHEAAVEEARLAHERSTHVWEAQVKQSQTRRIVAHEAHARAEAERIAALAAHRVKYEADCARREAEAVEQNQKLDAFIANLGYGSPEAVQEYISIVLSSSAYPNHFPVEHEFTFDPPSAELRLKVLIPAPGMIAEIKAYKYAKSSDEITSTSLSQNAARDRYASVIDQVALRSLHEVFESDRRGLIRTISLEVGCHTLDPATGLPTYVPFIAVGAERAAFLHFDLAAVVPARTLEKLGAAVSKNPHGLVAAPVAGVRRS